MEKLQKEARIIYDFDFTESGFEFTSNISSALVEANFDLEEIENEIEENLEMIKKLTPQCDKTDYILAASSGALCGIMDIFLVGKPGQSPLGNITDKWFDNRVKDFAKLCGWKDNKDFSSAVRFLEKKFKIPYDQRGAGDAGSIIFDLKPGNHHFKSLAHNPTLMGLFFSILDQFTNTSHFVSNGELISLQRADDSFELRGNNIPSKIFCGIANWFGHIMSDVAGASNSKGRGAGIPSPIMAWINDVIVLKRKLHIPVSEFDRTVSEFAVQMFNQGYDVRFQTSQAIPVLVNEMVVRLMYSVRRLIKYYSTTKKEERSYSLLWMECEPFSNATVKRMLTVAHGTFCMIDVGDAVIRGATSGKGAFDPIECVMRLNIIGIGRFSISLYGEAKRAVEKNDIKNKTYFLQRKRVIVNNYIEGLEYLSNMYDDKDLLAFVDDFRNSDMYKEAFEKTILLAEKRNVPNGNILRNKTDIDNYFKGGN